MPELPEVEINARNLRRWTAGRRVVSVEVSACRLLRPADPQAFADGLVGRSLEHIERRGKHLLLRFDADDSDRPVSVYSHLGMTGKWMLERPGQSPPSHSRARFRLDDGNVVHDHDPRLFGRLWRVEARRLSELPELRGLGPDPLLDGLDGALLAGRLRGTRRAIHAALLDQSVIAGAGNIYAQEALFRAGIDPRSPACTLPAGALERLARELLLVLQEALRRDDSEELTYVEEGAPNPFDIYARSGEPCPRCATPLERWIIGGRGVSRCPRCQRAATPARHRHSARRP